MSRNIVCFGTRAQHAGKLGYQGPPPDTSLNGQLPPSAFRTPPARGQILRTRWVAVALLALFIVRSGEGVNVGCCCGIPDRRSDSHI